VTVVPPNTNQPTITSGTTPAPGAPLVVAAVGDGASGDATVSPVVNTIQSWSPNLFLYLGDVYEKGSYTEFINWYEGGFGGLHSITNPVIGNHEYGTRRAAGYYDYWNNEPNYYSFDAGGWHFIALNSTSQFQNIDWSGQLNWLQSDLAAHAGACTVAFWHHPLYNVGPEGASTRVQDFWTPLANARATLILNGHDHDYQRWQPLDADGNPSSGGLTEIVAGTGGHAVQYITGNDPRLVTSKSGVFGALQLQLSPQTAQFQYYTISGSTSTVSDSGTVPCRGYGTLTGTVTDPITSNPVAGATVGYAGASTTTNSAGSYMLSTAPLGTYQLTASAIGYSDQSQTVTVNPASTTNRDFTLTPLPGSVSGTVINLHTGLPVAGATVSYTGGQAVTDAAGAYSLTSVQEGSYSFFAAASGFMDQTQTVGVGAGQAVVRDFGLAPLGTGSVGGQVIDSLTGSPINGASVSYFGGSATSDSSGTYSMSGLPDGTVRLTAATFGYTSISAMVPISSDTPATQNFALDPQPGSIAGTVTDSLTGQPLAGASVTYSGSSTSSDGNGRYSFTDVVEGTYSVSVNTTGYNAQSQQVVVGPGASITIDFALAPLPGSVSGTVTDVASGAPLAGATVTYSGGSVITNGSGQYSFPSLAEGTYSFTAGATGYGPQTRTAGVGPGASVGLNFSLVKRVFSDAFETGSMSSWTSNAGLVVQTSTVHSGSYAAEAASSGAGTYSRKSLSGTYSNLYVRTYVMVKSLPTTTVSLVGDRTSTSVSIARLYVDGKGRLALRNDAGGVSSVGPVMSTGAWHSVELHLIVNGTSSTTEVWLDGTIVAALSSQSANLGTAPIGQIQLGENQTDRSYDVAFDDLVVQTAPIGP
jgi:hypothetical protein